MLEKKPLGKDGREWKKIYVQSFPKKERSPFFLLKRGQKTGLCFPESWYLNGELAGITVTVPQASFCYLFFLAVEKEFRFRGIGGEILKEVKNSSSLPIVLDAEALSPASENAAEREQRSLFYTKRGFSPTGILTLVRGVEYETYCEKNFSLKEEEYRRFVRRRVKFFKA